MATIDADGTIAGVSTLAGTANLLVSTGGQGQGTSSVSGTSTGLVSGSGTAFGGGVMVGLPDIECVPAPVATVTANTPKTFKYLDPIQRGELGIWFSSFQGGAIDPAWVRYQLSWIAPSGNVVPAGPQQVPVRGKPGEYYAVGRAGDRGQPGRWIIEWWYRLYEGAPLELAQQCFRVYDAVLSNDSRDITERTVKYGWN